MELVPGNSLLTATPEEGRALAMKMARLVVKSTQPDGDVRGRLRLEYAENPDSLIALAQCVPRSSRRLRRRTITGGDFRSLPGARPEAP